MNDFTITACNYCNISRMRTNFSCCGDCGQLACAHTYLNCGIDCPCCDWFVCGYCIEEHSKNCWEKSDTACFFEDGDEGRVYSFFNSEPEPTKIKKTTVFLNSEGGLAKVILKK